MKNQSNGEIESYVSLSRMAFIDKKHLDKKGKYIFRKAGSDEHCGMFFLEKNKKMVIDDLTVRPYTLRTLRNLCNLLQDNVVVK